MLDDNDLKKLQKSLKDELRPIKELVEILQTKVSKVDLNQVATSSTIRIMKDQQSVINEKIDDLKEKASEDLEEMRKRIVIETGEFVVDHLAEQLDHKSDKSVTDRIDNRVDHLAVSVSAHETRIKRLEDISA